MRISILTIGAMGDTQPFVALASRLQERGHTVRLAARPDFQSLAGAYGIDFTPLGNPYKLVMGDREVASAIGSGSLVKVIRRGADRKQRQVFFERLDQDTLEAVRGAEAIIYKSSWIPFYSYAQKLGVPGIGAMLFPLTRTNAFPSFLLGDGRTRGAVVDSLLWRVTEQAVWQVARGYDTKLRRALLDLDPLPFLGPVRRQQKQGIPLLYAYSPTVLPRPADWPARVHVTGYWFADPPPGWSPPADLLSFLDAGPAPVYIGFGSMTGGDPDRMLHMILQALRLAGQRGILLSGWAGMGEGRPLPDYAFCVNGIPHAWLFPRMAAVVHHGGAGTTGAGLRAGAPSVLTPFVADQPSWGRRVEELGAGPRPIPFRELSAERLAEAIKAAVSDAGMRQRARSVGERIRGEDGLGTAVDLFSDYIRRGG